MQPRRARKNALNAHKIPLHFLCQCDKMAADISLKMPDGADAYPALPGSNSRLNNYFDGGILWESVV